MNYVVLLAGGKGTRMGSTDMPKQFLMLKGKPVIIYSIENLLKSSELEKIVISCNQDFIDYLRKIIDEYNYNDKVFVTSGGNSRFGSAMNGVKYIADNFGIKDDDVMLIQDSVRIFTSQRIVEENLKYAHAEGAAGTVYPLEETVSEINENGMLYMVYPRENKYTGQSPQAFNIKKFMKLSKRIPIDDCNKFTDLAEVFFRNGEVVHPVIGEKRNMKLTTPFDVLLAEKQLEDDNN